ncbi:cell division protein ZapA [Fructilactobacillus frigidiflavus]|uniref:cell division protein ZapA n=1 Tax=Fructilactobacillus frigidiflavus TaxID=3242688 RepID=UPI003756E541
MDNKKRFKAKIGNKDFTLIGTASEEHMTAVTKILNNELTKIKSQINRISDEDAAILLAFNAISNQLDKQLELDELKKKDANQ